MELVTSNVSMENTFNFSKIPILLLTATNISFKLSQKSSFSVLNGFGLALSQWYILLLLSLLTLSNVEIKNSSYYTNNS